MAAWLLAGCTALPSPPAAPPEPPAPPAPATAAAPAPEHHEPIPTPPPPQEAARAQEPVLQVLGRADALLRLGPAELAAEIARLSEAENAAVENPLLLATALVQTRQPVDTARALGLVQRVLGNQSAAAQALHPFARVLEARLLQQRRLEEQLERQAQQLRDVQRRNDQLSERLEAVRAIERSLTTRPATAPATAPAPAPTRGSGSQRPAP